MNRRANVKHAAVAAAVMVVAASAGFLLLDERKRSEEIDFIASVQSAGSGLFYRVGGNIAGPESLVSIDGDGNAVYVAENWNRLIFATMSVVSIQHIQLKTIVEAYLSDPAKVAGEPRSYDLVPYLEGQPLQDGKVYYIILTGTQMAEDKIIDGGIIALPRLLKIEQTAEFDRLVLTNDLFPHQTCCAVSVNRSFADAHPDVVARVLWAIAQATDWLNDALERGLEDPDDPDYQYVLDLAVNVANPSVYDTGDIREAIHDIEYAWGDPDPSDPLRTLKADVARMAEDLERIDAVTRTVGDLGFGSHAEYAGRQVDDSYLKEALKGKPEFTERAKVRFSLIGGDIHQLPIHVAEGKGFFDAAGIDFERFFVLIGHVVVNSLKADGADFGIQGQPPVIVDQINNGLARP